MMRIALLAKYNDGREQAVLVSAPDLVAFERQFDKSMSAVSTGRIEYLFWVTWHALKRKSLTDTEFDAWLELIDSVVDDPNAEVEIAPLESNQHTGSSST